MRNHHYRSFWRGLAVFCACFLLNGLVPDLEAQVTTNITSSGLGTTVESLAAGETTITGGTRPGTRGPNLFHSFGDFTVGVGDTANFQNGFFASAPIPTTNIISRVTGGQISNIYGTLKTTNFGGANLFLINPAGVVFGPSASLNVGGSVNISTADYLKLADGVRFNAIPGPSDALLSTAPVAAFGFLNSSPLGISITGSTLQVPEKTFQESGKTLSLVAGPINIVGGTLEVQTPQSPQAIGRIALVSVGSNGEVFITTPNVPNPPPSPTLPPTVLKADTVSRLGTINLENTTLRTGLGGTIELSGRTIDILNGSRLTGRPESGPDPGIGSVTIHATESVRIAGDQATIFAPTKAGQAGRVEISADTLTLDDGTIFLCPGNCGEVEPGGSAGQLVLSLQELNLTNGGRIDECCGLANRPSFVDPSLIDFDITATESVLISGRNQKNASGIYGQANTGLHPARIKIRTGTLSMDGGVIDSNAGISVNANTVNLTGGATIDSSSARNVGNIDITATKTFQSVGSTLTAAATVQGNGGNITLNAGERVLIQDSTITAAATSGSGNGGDIAIDPTAVVLQNAQVLATAAGGNGGNISIAGGVVLVDPNSRIDASSVTGTSGSAHVAIKGTSNPGNPINNQLAVQNLNRAVLTLPQGVLPMVLANERCPAMEKELSTFAQVGRGAPPPVPGSFLPSPLLVEDLSISSGARPQPMLTARRLGMSNIGLEFPILVFEQGCGS